MMSKEDILDLLSDVILGIDLDDDSDTTKDRLYELYDIIKEEDFC